MIFLKYVEYDMSYIVLHKFYTAENSFSEIRFDLIFILFCWMLSFVNFFTY